MESSDRAERVLEALAAVEPRQAEEELRGLIESLEELDSDGFDLPDFRTSFVRLLGRRGYFVSTPAEIKASLTDIRRIGPGFDLYDLAEALANYDAVLMAQSGRPRQRIIPELEAFSPSPHDSKETPLWRSQHVVQ